MTAPASSLAQQHEELTNPWLSVRVAGNHQCVLNIILILNLNMELCQLLGRKLPTPAEPVQWCNSVIGLTLLRNFFMVLQMKYLLLVLRWSVECILLSGQAQAGWLSRDRHTRRKWNNLTPKSDSYSKEKSCQVMVGVSCLRAEEVTKISSPQKAHFKSTKEVSFTCLWFLTPLCLQASAFTVRLA